jgi:glycine betaine/proline transport system ATP-binding protein
VAAIALKNVDIIFGEHPEKALSLLDEGASRDTILAETGQILGAADATISIEQGEVCVLMGLSGSGKSTLLRAINGLNRVTRGQVLVDYKGAKIDVATCNARTLRELRMHKIAMVFQQFALLPWRTVKENVALGLELRGLRGTELDAIVLEKLEIVGLSQWADKYAHELSGGMQQRVGLARAFATDADILLMDEPFSALDPLIRDKLQDELLELQQALKKTIVFVSHDLDEAMKLGTHIAIMEGGRIVQYGEPEQIVLNPVNDYVAEFVAHMNPIHVLRAASLMTPVSAMKQNGDTYELDWSGQNQISLNEQGEITGATVNGRTAQLCAYGPDKEIIECSRFREPTLVYASPEILMSTAIKIRYHTGLPVPLVESGKLVGVISGDEIFQGLLRLSGKETDHGPA